MKVSLARLSTALGHFCKKNPKNSWLLSILGLLLIGWLAFFWHLGNTGLVDETEPLFAEAARQMTVTGDWITPYFNGVTRFDKPILVYWLMAIAYKILGVNEWAVRLPSAMAAMSLTALGFYTLQRFGLSTGRENPASLFDAQFKPQKSTLLWLSAWIGAALMALNPLMITWARTGVSDMLLTACMDGALLCFFVGYAAMDRNKNSQFLVISSDLPEDSNGKTQPFSVWYIACYVLIALGVLTKGPVGIVLPGLIIGAFLIYLGNFRKVWREMRPGWGAVIVAAIALPWYVLVTWQNGETFIDAFFGYHNLQRFTSVVNHHWAPWYFYFIVLLIGFAPWSVYLPIAIANIRVWERKNWRTSPRSTQLGLFAFFWFTGVFLFFTVAVTKLPSYILPLIPASAILVALLWSSQTVNGNPDNRDLDPISQKAFGISIFFNIVLLSAVAIVIFYTPKILGYDPAIPDLPQLLKASSLPLWGALIWGSQAVAIAIFLRWRRLWRWIWSVNFCGFVAFIIFVLTPAYFLVDQARQLPLRQLAATIVQQERPGEELIMVGFTKPTVVFYTHNSVAYFPLLVDAVVYMQSQAYKQPKSPSVLLLIESNKIKGNLLKRYQYQKLQKSNAYTLFRVFHHSYKIK